MGFAGLTWSGIIVDEFASEKEELFEISPYKEEFLREIFGELSGDGHGEGD